MILTKSSNHAMRLKQIFRQDHVLFICEGKTDEQIKEVFWYFNVDADENNNAVISKQVFLYQSENNIVRISEDKVAVLQGLEGYIVVDTKDALLICKKEEEQKWYHQEQQRQNQQQQQQQQQQQHRHSSHRHQHTDTRTQQLSHPCMPYT